MRKKIKIVLTTMPNEGQFIDWTTPAYYRSSAVKYMPLGILSLASNVDDDCEVVILDPSSEGWSINETIKRIEKENPDVLGLSVVTQKVYAMNEILKKTKVSYKIVGGPHATNYAEKIIKSGADAVFIGGLADLEFKEAVKTKKKGIIFCNTKINEINYPKREFVEIENYFPKESILFKANNRLPMFTSSGCPHRCLFCDVQNKKLQLKDPKKVVDEMEYLASLKCGSVHVLDDNFNIDERHVNQIMDEMDKRNFSIEWSGRGQARMSEALAKRLSEHNFKRIHVGIESLSDDILTYFRKSVNVADIEKFCILMKKYNIDVVAYFIVGTPIDTQEYLKELPNKIRKLGIKHPYFNILYPSPNTEYYNNLVKDGTYKKDYWKEYMENPTPNYILPYPYSEEKYKEIAEYVTKTIEEFKNN